MFFSFEFFCVHFFFFFCLIIFFFSHHFFFFFFFFFSYLRCLLLILFQVSQNKNKKQIQIQIQIQKQKTNTNTNTKQNKTKQLTFIFFFFFFFFPVRDPETESGETGSSISFGEPTHSEKFEVSFGVDEKMEDGEKAKKRGTMDLGKLKRNVSSKLPKKLAKREDSIDHK